MTTVLITAAISAIATTIALAAVRPVLLRVGIVDVPNHRSSHSTPTVRSGGIGIAIGLWAGCMSVMMSTGDEKIASFFVGTTAFAFLGAIEDLKGISIKVRLVSQVAVATFMMGQIIKPDRLTAYILCASLILGLVFYVNAANFVDGINGISGLHGLVAGVYFALIGALAGDESLMLFAVAVGVSFTCFLPWNAPKARFFLGDSGSYLLGAAVSSLAVWAISVGISPAVSVAPMMIYVADVTRTLLTRTIKGSRLTDPHRDHVYQQLQRVFDSHLASAFVCTAATVACCLVALFFFDRSSNLLIIAFAYFVVIALYLSAAKMGAIVFRKEIPQ